MNKSKIVGQVADGLGLSRAAAGNAVDAMIQAVDEALAPVQEQRNGDFRVRRYDRACPSPTNFENSRTLGGPSVDGADVQGRRDIG